MLIPPPPPSAIPAALAEPSSQRRPHPGAPAILVTAIAIGVAGDLLLRATPWGLNVTLWLALVGAAAILLPRPHRFALGPARGSGWLLTAIAISLMFAWRASPVLQWLNLFGVAFAFSMVGFRSPAGAHNAGVVGYATNLAISAAEGIVGAVVLALRTDWRALQRGERPQRMRAVGVGFGIALPLVLLFGGLFASADSHFSSLLQGLAPVSAPEAASHLGLWLLFTWLAASYLWSALLTERPAALNVPRASWLKLEGIETGVVFGALNLLFFAFVAVQFRYLFGGADQVTASETLTYSAYARRGFFELVTVAALILPVLLLGHWLLAPGRPRLERGYRLLAGGLVLLVLVVMASAFERMRLYQAAFGLTGLRLYTTAFMAWLLLVLLWFGWTVLRGRRELFAAGAAASALVMVVGLNALNPDAFIVRRNAAADRAFDTAYALGLSPDAMPELVHVLEGLPGDQRCAALAKLRERREGWTGDWRSWNWSRSRAAAAVDGAPRCVVGG
jgi:Domain of unknown function (DUF4173)